MDSLLNWVLQGGVVVLAAAAGLRAIHMSRTGARSLVLWTAYAIVLALPAVPWMVDAMSPAAFGSPEARGGLIAAGPVVGMPDAWWTSPALVAAGWLGWSVASALRLGADILAVRSARRACQPCSPAIEARLPIWRRVSATGRPTRVMLSTRVGSAAVLSCGWPVIAVAPALVDRLADDDLDRVVVHEWAHVQRRDDLVYAVQVLLGILVGWHPALWWLDRQLTLEREAGCDGLAVRVTGSAKLYASCLATLAGLPRDAGRLGALAAARSGLHRRVVRILALPRRGAVRSGWQSLVCTISGVGGCALVVGHVNLIGALEAASIPPRRPAVTAAAAVRPSMAAEPGASRTDPVRPPVDRRVRSTSAPASTGQVEVQPPSMATAGSEPGAPVAAPVRPEPEREVDEGTGLPAAPAASAEVGAEAPAPAPPIEIKPRAAWTAAADAGVAIGHSYRDAGVATGGFFKRLGKKIARSF